MKKIVSILVSVILVVSLIAISASAMNIEPRGAICGNCGQGQMSSQNVYTYSNWVTADFIPCMFLPGLPDDVVQYRDYRYGKTCNYCGYFIGDVVRTEGRRYCTVTGYHDY